jgi:hypothetical protein
MQAAPIAGGCIGGIRDDDRDRTFLGERRIDFSPFCSGETRPPSLAALSFIFMSQELRRLNRELPQLLRAWPHAGMGVPPSRPQAIRRLVELGLKAKK